VFLAGARKDLRRKHRGLRILSFRCRFDDKLPSKPKANHDSSNGGMLTLTRRDAFRSVIATPASLFLIPFRALAEQHLKKVKITEITALQIKNIAGNSLIRIKTDSGVVGYGEAGASGPMARARIETMKPLLIGQDPLEIEVHFENMTSLMHPYVAHIPTISGIDIALWDLAGKILGVSVSTLLGGPFRDSILMYSHGVLLKNALDPASCRDWAQAIRQLPEGFNAFKIDIHPIIGVTAGRFADTLNSAQLRNVNRAYKNLREAVGDEIDIAVHCHNELDTPSAIGVAKAVETMSPLSSKTSSIRRFRKPGWPSARRPECH
jgi:mandelate racemase/muconate lactonizing enzyme-like protein